MRPFGPLWNSMEPYGVLWSHTKPCEALWGPTRSPVEPYGALWSSMKPCEAQWSPMKPYGPLWSPMEPNGDLWSPMELYGPLWSSMKPSEAVWSPMEPFEALSSFMAPFCHVFSTGTSTWCCNGFHGGAVHEIVVLRMRLLLMHLLLTSIYILYISQNFFVGLCRKPTFRKRLDVSLSHIHEVSEIHLWAFAENSILEKDYRDTFPKNTLEKKAHASLFRKTT